MLSKDKIRKEHALIAGIYFGLTEWTGISQEDFKDKDVRKQKYCTYAGYIIGTLIRWGYDNHGGYEDFYRNMMQKAAREQIQRKEKEHHDLSFTAPERFC